MNNPDLILTFLNQLKSRLEIAKESLESPLALSYNDAIVEAIQDCVILVKQINLDTHVSDSVNTTVKLLDREQFKQKLTESIKNAQLTQTQYALCFIDLDQFKIINELCGHAAGEELLYQLTPFFQKQVPNNGIIAYLGGDEYGLLLKQCSLSQAQKIAENLRFQIESFRFSWQDRSLSISASIGLIVIDPKTPDWSYALSSAESACQVAKQRGGNRVLVYYVNDEELLQQRSEREWVLRLNQALKENRFFLYAQKIAPINPNSGLDHYEILLRLLDEAGHFIPPGVFIPIAERYHLMPAIDRWVINQFFSSYEHHYQKKSPPHNTDWECLYTINLSAASINNDQFLNFLTDKIARSKIPPQTICFEITETAAIANLQQAAHFIRTVKEKGCRFALDDFGTGMSSLAYLKSLPVDYLKIDGSFVKNMVNDPIDHVIVECFNQIGHAMKMKTIAEFVEEEAILEKLRTVGVDYAQGYGIARPSPLSFNQHKN